MGIAGGLRARLIRDNMYDVVNDGLTELGWMNDDRPHNPVEVRIDQVPHGEVAEPNIVVVTAEDLFESPMEMGSLAGQHTWMYYIDVYAEDNILGMALATDIRDILQGRFTSSVSRIGPDVDVYDLRLDLATPHRLFSVEIENVDMNKSRAYEQPYEKFWWVVDFQLLDFYTSEEDEL